MAFRKTTTRTGFTLLELILSLALTALLMGVVATAVDTYWRAHDRGRSAVENAQLARALLSQIADDLRSTIAPPPDHSAAVSETAENLKTSIAQIQSQMQSSGQSNSDGQGSGGTGSSSGSQGGSSGSSNSGSAGGGSSGGGTSGNGQSGNSGGQSGNTSPDGGNPLTGGSVTNPSTGTNGDSNNSGTGNAPSAGGTSGQSSAGATITDNSTSAGAGSANTSANADILADSTATEETTAPLAPRMYGSQYELQIDVSRPMRPDQIRLSGGMMPGSTTLHYRLENPTAVADASTFDTGTNLPELTNESTVSSLGLVRQESNRILYAWNGESSRDNGSSRQVNILAPEVAGLEFRYFDGTEWLSEWDSDTQQSTPAAIEVLLTLRLPQSRTGMLSWASESESLEQHRMVVHLPNRITVPPETTETSSTTQSGDTSSTSQSSTDTSQGSQTGGSGSSSSSSGASNGATSGDTDDDQQQTRGR